MEESSKKRYRLVWLKAANEYGEGICMAVSRRIKSHRRYLEYLKENLCREFGLDPQKAVYDVVPCLDESVRYGDKRLIMPT